MKFINTKPIIIKSTDIIDEDDEFTEEYIGINTNNKVKLYYSNSCFDSIYHLGELIQIELNNHQISNIRKILTIEKNIKNDLIKKYINPWIKVNGNPYRFKKLNNTILITDSIELYLIYEIHKWLIKLNTQKEKMNIKRKKNESYEEVNEILTLLKYIEMDDFIKYKLQCHKRYIVNSLDFNKNAEWNYLEKILNKDSTISNDNDLDKFIKYITRCLIEFTIAKFENNEDYTIKKQQPYYVIESDQYRILKTGESLMGIAYNKLLLHLTSTRFNRKREICHAPGCNNEFVKNSSNDKYCSNDACRQFANSLKCKKQTLKRNAREIISKADEYNSNNEEVENLIKYLKEKTKRKYRIANSEMIKIETAIDRLKEIITT